MFLNNKRNEPGGAEYQQRILELEAELDAAQKLIDDQQSVLKANLSALVTNGLPQDGEAAAPTIPARPLTAQASYSEQPPIKLPELGPPAGDIANRVLRAAADRGVVGSGPAQLPLPSPAPATGYPPLPRPPRVPPSWLRRQGIGLPLMVSSVLLFGCVLFAAMWARLPALTPARHSGAAKVLAAMPSTVAVESPSHPSSPTSVVAGDSGGPVLEPMPLSAVRRASEHKGARSIKFVKRPGPAAREGITFAQVTAAQLHPRIVPPVSFHRRTRAHRYQDPAESGGQDWFDREASRHPRPGWDENDDKWLDKF